MQCNFSYDIAGGIFSSDTEHFWGKWLRTEGNMIEFLSNLDVFNRKKMIEWGKTLVPP